MTLKWRITKSCRPHRGLDVWLRHIPGVSIRSTPGSILPPAPQAENVNIYFERKFDEMKHVTPVTASYYPRG
jgi:hypothetical protein